MTEEEVREIQRLKAECVDASLKVERANRLAAEADWKFADFLHKVMQKKEPIQ